MILDPFRGRRGATLALVAGALVALMGAAALAIDVGMLHTARSEAQRAAEAGAHAGALVFLGAPNDEELARKRARHYAEANQVRWMNVELRDEDIYVDPDDEYVRVEVHRTDTWGGPILTFFARALGVGSVNVGAAAAARTWPADGASCILPFAAPDRWSVGGGYDNYPSHGDVFDPDEDSYVPWNAGDPEAPYTGYSVDSRGVEMRLYSGDPDEAPQPGWWYAFVPHDVSPGADALRDRILGCPDDDIHRFGDEMDVETEPGAMAGPVRQAFEDLIDEDRYARWDERAECVTRGDGVCLSPGDTPRIRPMVLFDPSTPPEQGRSTFTIMNFVGVFIERIEHSGGQVDVYARFLEYQGLEPPDEWHDGDAPLRIVRIVE